MKKLTKIILVLVLLTLTLSACTDNSSDKHIVFANAGWDSILFHNAVAGTIAEEVYGYTWSEVSGSTPVMHEGILSGEVDVHMEEWTDNIPSYPVDLEAGKFKELSVNFDDNYQGFYVPRYVIEGDSERGIEAMAPDLKYVWDLKDYPDVFPDDDDPDMGRVYGAIPGWEVDQIMHNKYLHYGLNENFVYFRPGSEAALASALTNADEKGEAVVGYYWEPTWLMGKYDFVLLDDEPHDESNYMDGESAMPPVRVTIGVSNNFAEGDPEDESSKGNSEMVEFLSNYETSSQLTSDALGYMQDTGSDYIETAKWFLKENDHLIDEWLNEEDAKILREYLQ